MLQINSKAIAAAAVCQAVKDVRYYLNGVYVQPLSSGSGARVIATDGHRMIVVTDTEAELAEEFHEKGVILAFENTAITKMKAKNAGTLTVSRVDEDTVIAKTESGHLSSVEVIDGTYPDWTAVVPDQLPAKSTNKSAFQAEYMAGFCAVAKILDVSGGAVSFVNGADENSAICVRFGVSRFEGLHAKGVLMPLRASALPWKP